MARILDRRPRRLPVTAAWAPASPPRLAKTDLCAAAAVFVVGWALAAIYLPSFRSAGGVQQFYQEEYGPAVMAACGRGFVNPDLQSTRMLHAFLNNRIQTFDCRSLPASVAVIQFDELQGVTRYLLVAAGIMWRIRGVTWPALDSLFAAMYAVAVAGAYLALRFVSGRVLSLVGTALWVVSPMHLQNLPHLRDYSKAPYLVLTIIAMAIVIAERNAKRLAAVGAAFGLVQGIGLGMRSDVLLNFIPFFVALFFAGRRRVTEQLKEKLVCAGAAIAVFIVASLPILRAYTASEGFWHVSLLGLTTPFDQALHVRPAPYDFGYAYNDSYMKWVAQSQWSRRHAGGPQADPDTAPPGAASREYYTTLAAAFPGDFATRIIGSVLSVLNLSFSNSYGYAPLGVSNAFLVRMETWRVRMLLRLAGAGPLLAATLIVLIGMTRPRDAVVGFVLVGFFAAYPFLQFHGRHVFQLEFLVIGMLVWLASLGWRAAVSKPGPLPSLVWRSMALMTAMCVAVAAAVAVARTVQKGGARTLLAAYDQAPTEAVPATRISLDDGRVRLLTPMFDDASQEPGPRYALVVVDVLPDRCASSSVDLTFRYQRLGVPADLDFSRLVTVPAAAAVREPTRVFFPAYGKGGSDPEAGFIGIDVPAAQVDCIRVARVRDTRSLPLLLDATLPPGWENRPLYARVGLAPLMPESVWVRVARWWPGLAALG
jgi:hypothetical protein